MSEPAPPERAQRTPEGTLQPAAPALGAARGPAPGHRIGALELVARLGSGGMGEVWEARDLELDRLVAVKLMSPELSAPDAARRFRREARAAASINHPHVAQVHFAGLHEDRLFYVMEHAGGSSLERWLRERGRLPPARALDLLRQAAEGLRAALRVGVIHRDLKPANLMVDERWQLKIVDFGLARREVDTTLTRANAVLGTPTYMAPEQARGREVDHRADIYSLGATFYHLLSGKPPFHAPGALQLAERHVSTPLPPLAGRAPGVPKALCAVIERMLAKDPARRFQSYDQLLAALAEAREHVGDGEGDEPASGRGRRWLAVVAVLVALVAAAGLLARRGVSPPKSGPAATAADGSAGAPAAPGSGRTTAEASAATLHAAAGAAPDPAAALGPSELDAGALEGPLEDTFPFGELAPEAARAEGAARDLTAERMRQVTAAIGAYARESGRSPRTLEELAAAQALAPGLLRDGWGGRLLLERPGSRGALPFLVSAGPDRRARTADDLFFVAGRLRSAPVAPPR